MVERLVYTEKVAGSIPVGTIFLKMELTKKELIKISSTYNLGNIRNVKQIQGGMINYNFFVKTDKGNYIVRKLGYKIGSWQMNKKELEFGVIEYLRENKFPYEMPFFLKNKNGNYVSRIYGNLFVEHESIPGRKIRKHNDKQLKEIVKAVAIYHKIMKNFPLEKKFN